MNRLDAARSLAQALTECKLRVVFAESCTGGLVAATLAEVPSVSQVLCGSAVVYREATKQEWLGVAADDLAEHTAVSETVARQMALGVLERTPEADLAASVTGHLGPNAPADLDGVVYIGIARRNAGQLELVGVTRHQLTQTARVDRQHEATQLVLGRVREAVLAR